MRFYLPGGKSFLIKNTHLSGTIAYRNGKLLSSHITARLGEPVGGTVMLVQTLEKKTNRKLINLAIYKPDLFTVLNSILGGNLAAGSVPFQLEVDAVLAQEIESLEMRGALTNLSFEDHNFENAAEGLNIDLSAKASSKDGEWKITGTLNCSGGNLFSKGFFFDFSSIPLVATFNSLFRTERSYSGTADIRLGNFILFSISGNTGRLHWKLQIPDLEALINPPFVNVVEEALPVLRKLKAAGSFGAEGVYGHGSVSGCLKGMVKCTGCSILSGNLSARFDVDLPLYLDAADRNSQCPDEEIKGQISVKEIRTGDFSLADLHMPVVASLNTWVLEDPIKLDLPWGRILITRVDFSIFPEPRGTLKVDLPASLKIRLSHRSLAYPLEIELQKTSVDVLYQNDRLEISPALKFRVFSGNVILDRLRVEDLLLPSRSIVIDAHWKGLDLEKLSRLASFGIIKGKLSGEVKNLRIAYGLPVSFDLRLMSEPSEEQTISVLAVRNITQIGSSGNPFQGLTGTVMTTFFKEFPYDRIGIRCRLKNDRFSITGLIKEGDTEYLIRRRGLRGINVINRQSPNVISWNEMIRRLKRIERVESAKTEGTEQ